MEQTVGALNVHTESMGKEQSSLFTNLNLSPMVSTAFFIQMLRATVG